MTQEVYSEKMKAIATEAKQKEQMLNIEYALLNNPYSVGDKFTDHIGTILIEKIKTTAPLTLGGFPSCVYFGKEVLKSGQLSKKEGRWAYQYQDITKKQK